MVDLGVLCWVFLIETRSIMYSSWYGEEGKDFFGDLYSPGKVDGVWMRSSSSSEISPSSNS